MGGLWREIVGVYFEVAPSHFPGGTEEDYERRTVRKLNIPVKVGVRTWHFVLGLIS
jgi:hypothetical protein